MQLKKFLVPIISVGALTVGGLAVASPAWAAPEAAACALYSDAPIQDGGTLKGRGGRVGCADAANVAVSMYEEIALWPDKRIGSASQNGVTNVDLWVTAGCTGIRGPYYIATNSSSGNTYEGTHVTLC